MGPSVLADALEGLEPSKDPDLIVGFETSDDAAVYRISDDKAIITTVDFITPPVDDPYWFGQIAAANSLSDVYAMGGKPIIALNVVMFPSKQLDMTHLKEILRGGHDKVMEAGASMAGGHSVDDLEPKYGLAVTGIVHPDKILTNCRAEDGDTLVLTKPIGSGVLFNACRSGKLAYEKLKKVLPIVASLNGTALDIALKYDVHSCTDITGFGISGHVLEIARGSQSQIRLHYGNIPLYDNAIEMYRAGEMTGSNKANKDLVEGSLEISASLSKEEEELLFDPQTSGGLLFSVPSSQADDLIRDLQKAGIIHSAAIGEVKRSDKSGIKVV
ncbi:MAG: selenide, water dikinase SelD [Nitrospirota bacterium]|nr:MAG: selenide, water dikinase SelD [Nitrospirota bacterium]